MTHRVYPISYWTERHAAAEAGPAQWLEVACELGPEHRVSSAAAYGSYSDWCDMNAKPKLTHRSFSRRLFALGVGKQIAAVKSGSVRYFKGFRINAQQHS